MRSFMQTSPPGPIFRTQIYGIPVQIREVSATAWEKRVLLEAGGEELRKYRVTWSTRKGAKPGQYERSVYVWATSPSAAREQVREKWETQSGGTKVGRATPGWGSFAHVDQPDVASVRDLPEILRMIEQDYHYHQTQSGERLIGLDPEEVNVLLQAIRDGSLKPKYDSKVAQAIRWLYHKEPWMFSPEQYQKQFERQAKLYNFASSPDWSERLATARKLYKIIKSNQETVAGEHKVLSHLLNPQAPKERRQAIESRPQPTQALQQAIQQQAGSHQDVEKLLNWYFDPANGQVRWLADGRPGVLFGGQRLGREEIEAMLHGTYQPPKTYKVTYPADVDLALQGLPSSGSYRTNLQKRPMSKHAMSNFLHQRLAGR